MKPKIIIVGSSNTDMIIKVRQIPMPGETIIGGEFFKVLGGKGANQAVAAARAGGDVVFLGCVGNDSFGKEALEGMRKEGIDVSQVKISTEKPSGIALINVADSGENSITVASGANAQLFPADIAKWKAVLQQAQMILLQHEIPLNTIRTIIETAFDLHIPVILNPAPAFPVPADLLPKIFLLTPNEHEASLIAGTQNLNEEPGKLAKELFGIGCRQLIITLGSKGAMYATADKEILVPGIKVQALDTTAAGDTFNGYLAVALADGIAMEDAIRLANRAAAISVTRMGAQSSIPFLSELKNIDYVYNQEPSYE
jgi:ribokinase